MSQPDPSDVPYGCCHCGCGGKTSLAPQSAARSGMVRGEPMRYLPGHSTRGRRYVRKPERWRVEDRGYDTPCWIWLLAINPNGYGRAPIGDQQQAYAHRVAYEKAKGPIGEGLVVDHLCSVRACVNPDHLEAVTQAENLRRTRERSRACNTAALAAP